MDSESWLASLPQKQQEMRARQLRAGHRSARRVSERLTQTLLELELENECQLRREHPAECKAFDNAVQRCANRRNPAFKDYGGRGIKSLFTSFTQFFAELGPRPSGKSLDRYPNNNGYHESRNVRWATPKEQSSNRRRNAGRYSVAIAA